jgi:hypothetical protein
MTGTTSDALPPFTGRGRVVVVGRIVPALYARNAG